MLYWPAQGRCNPGSATLAVNVDISFDAAPTPGIWVVAAPVARYNVFDGGGFPFLSTPRGQ